MANISERPVSTEIMALIKGSSTQAAEYFELDPHSTSPAKVVAKIDDLIHRMTRGFEPKFQVQQQPEFLFGSLWGEQLIRELNWHWGTVTYHDFEDASAVGVVSPLAEMVIFPFAFLEACLKEDVPVTVLLSFNMLRDGSSIPELAPESYEDVMQNVQHIVPRQ